MGLWKNMLDYSHSSLAEIVVSDKKYRTVSAEKPSVIVGASFGTTSCNMRLAEAVYDARIYFNPELPAIVQKGIFDNYINMHGIHKTISVGTDTDRDISKVVSEVNTRGVLSLARDVIDANYLDRGKLLYVAHPAHMQRVIEVGKKLGLNGVPFLESDVQWSDRDDRERWTISPARWALREIFARVHHRIKGYT